MTTITQTITALPTPPNPNAPATFNTLAYPYTVAQNAMGPEINTLAGQMNTVAGEVDANRVLAETSVTDAQAEVVLAAAQVTLATVQAVASANSAGDSETFASIAAGTANYAGEWSSLTGAKVIPLSVSHNASIWVLVTNVADVTATEPGVTSDWALVDGAPYGARTSNTILTTSDRGKVLNITSGTFSQTFSAAADLGASWYIQIMNSGTGTVTLDPNASELINGASTLALNPDKGVLIFCTGTALTAIFYPLIVGDHVVEVHTGNGHGSTNTKIRRFTTTMTNTGTAIVYADSATNGASFTIAHDGIYAVNYTDRYSASSTSIGISLNSAALTTAVGAIPAATRKSYVVSSSNVGYPQANCTIKCAAGDIVRPHTSGVSDLSSDSCYFSIRKIASL